MEKEHHQQSLALIDQKIAAEKQTLSGANTGHSRTRPSSSPEAKALEINAMRLEHEARLAKLQGERQRHRASSTRKS